jgi:hypothetical protein
MSRKQELGLGLVVGSLLLTACSARGADDRADKKDKTFAGSWKLSMAMAGGQRGQGGARPAGAASRRAGAGGGGGQARALTTQILLNLTNKGGKIGGDFVGFTGKPAAIRDVKMKDGEISFKVPQQMGPNTFNIDFVAKLSGDKMEGTAKIATPAGVREFPFQGDRLKTPTVSAAGTWRVQIALKDGTTFQPTLKIVEVGNTLKGSYVGEHGETAIANALVFGDEVTFDVAHSRDGKKYRLHFQGKIKSDALKGIVDYDFDGMTGYVGFTAERAATR